MQRNCPRIHNLEDIEMLAEKPQETHAVRIVPLLIVPGYRPHLVMVRRCRGRPCWILPGGTQEAGEEPVDTAVRELKGEAGIVVKKDDIDQNSFMDIKYFRGRQNLMCHDKWVLCLLSAEMRTCGIAETNEIAEMRLFPIDELPPVHPRPGEVPADVNYLRNLVTFLKSLEARFEWAEECRIAVEKQLH